MLISPQGPRDTVRAGGNDQTFDLTLPSPSLSLSTGSINIVLNGQGNRKESIDKMFELEHSVILDAPPLQTSPLTADAGSESCLLLAGGRR